MSGNKRMNTYVPEKIYVHPPGFRLSLSEQQGSSRAYTRRCSSTRMVADEETMTPAINKERWEETSRFAAPPLQRSRRADCV